MPSILPLPDLFFLPSEEGIRIGAGAEPARQKDALLTADPARQRQRGRKEEVGVFRLSSLPDEKADIVQSEGQNF